MDIAEIRKKAKAQAKPDGAVVEPVTPQNLAQEASESVPLERQGEVAVTATTTEQKAVAVVEDKHAAARRATEGIDRLFAAVDDFSLATDESYAGTLDNQADSQAQSYRQYLAFHLGDEEYALDIIRISEIIKIREFTDVPRTPDFVLGIISLRGVVVPVFDLRQRLNLGASEMMPTTRIVVCQQDDVTVGLLVDSINQVVNLTDDDVEPPPGVLSGLDREMVAGIGRYQGRMIILLNLQSALNIELN
jgi:purine-binding chemotaxis protein CheW